MSPARTHREAMHKCAFQDGQLAACAENDARENARMARVTRRPLEDRIAAAEQRLARLRAEAARKRARAEKAERARDTRRKILVGAVALAEAARDPAFDARLRELLDAALTRPDDRELLGLRPLLHASPPDDREAPR